MFGPILDLIHVTHVYPATSGATQMGQGQGAAKAGG
jgi:hypothetical protein